MRPTTKQLSYIRRLALSRGISFTPPTSKAQASQLIQQLKTRRPSSRTERAIERARAHRTSERAQSSAAVRDDEIVGYGSNARWA